MYGGSAESFGKQWGPGDVVGVFLDLVDHTISKKKLPVCVPQVGNNLITAYAIEMIFSDRFFD